MSKIPNARNLWPEVMKRLAVYDPGNRYAVVNATNLTPPVVWTPLVTNVFGADGSFSYTNPVSAVIPQLFLRLTQ